MAGTYSNMMLHVVFSTRSRYPFISADVQQRLYDYVGGIIRGEKGTVYAIGGMPDHVHILLRWRPDMTVSDLLRKIKAHSSGWIHRTYPALEKFEWQRGYGVFSVSRSQIDEVAEYIQHQAEHHRRRTFEEEFLAFLRAHDVSYDERYVWH